jgi:hypothetical protein
VPAIFRGRGGQTVAAGLAYIALTVVMTWPIARGLASDVPGDLGDALLNMWIMAWDAEAFVAMASGTMSFADFWNGNIFHPAPLSLTFSEHLVPQALQGLPFYLATGNIVLAYNVVFLSTFALSGLGMFLFVRELTGSARVGFVAGLFYAFLPYRFGQFSHVQTLSSQWMPLALLGLRRYFDSGRLAPLAGGTAAFVVQGLSTGYYLFYFAPVFGGYVAWEMTVRGRWREVRTWLALASAGVASVALILPFLLPYAEARASQGLTRPYDEVLRFSADLFSYANAFPGLWLWGPTLNRYPRPEGDLFLGAVPIALAVTAVVAWSVRAWWESRTVALGANPTRHRVVVGLLALAVAAFVLAMTVIAGGGFSTALLGLPLRVTSTPRALTVALVFTALALALSPRLRAAIGARADDLTPFLAIAFVFAVVMSLGPTPRAGGARLAWRGVYRIFYEWVPGYEGLRVPARFAMVAAVALVPMAGYALAPVARWAHGGTAVLALVSVAFLAESYAVPVATNVNWSTNPRYAAPWSEVRTLNEGPLAYRHLLTMPADTIVMELPFGDQAWDLRYVYYAGLHGKRIVNGYSGYFPDGYAARAARIAGVWSDRDAAWEAIATAGATHVLVHASAYQAAEGAVVAGWIGNMGARRVADFADGDVLLALPPR